MKKKYMPPCMGQKVDVEGVHLHVYTEGAGKSTLVFMAGFGMCSPTLSFKSLYTKLIDRYKTVVVEKPGYGFADASEAKKDIHTLVNWQRKALLLCGIAPPYILCPCSFSGLEALYWAQQYPDEVCAMVGLDMTFPALMKEYKSITAVSRLFSFFMQSGIVRLFPSIVNDETMQHGNLTKNEKEVYTKLFFQKSFGKDIVNEAAALKENIGTVEKSPLPTIPMLLFVSNGDETGIKKDVYLKLYADVLKSLPHAKAVHLDCQHHVYLFARETIANTLLHDNFEC